VRNSPSCRTAALLGMGMLATLACVPGPNVYYTPVEYNYTPHGGIDPSAVGVYMQNRSPGRHYMIVGEGYAALRVNDFTVEQGIEALRRQAAKRGCDAIIDVQYVQQEKQMPAMGGIAGGTTGFGGGYRGSYSAPCGFVTAKFVVWQE